MKKILIILLLLTGFNTKAITDAFNENDLMVIMYNQMAVDYLLDNGMSHEIANNLDLTVPISEEYFYSLLSETPFMTDNALIKEDLMDSDVILSGDFYYDETYFTYYYSSKNSSTTYTSKDGTVTGDVINANRCPACLWFIGASIASGLCNYYQTMCAENCGNTCGQAGVASSYCGVCGQNAQCICKPADESGNFGGG